MKDFKLFLFVMLSNLIIWVVGFSILIIYDSFQQSDIPKGVLVITKIESLNPDVGVYTYKYTLTDKHGNNFYLTEASSFREPPYRMIGQVISSKKIEFKNNQITIDSTVKFKIKGNTLLIKKYQ